MAERKAGHEPTLWESLPKKEQERVRQHLEKMRTESPKQAANGRNGGFSLKGYVRCELSKSDKAAYVEWEAGHSDTECYGVLVKLADSGYLLKVGESGNGHQASLSAYSTGNAWDGYVLVSHASNAQRAVMLLVYKHTVLLDADWEAFIGDGGEEDFR